MQSEIRKELLDAFTNAGDSYLSGQYLADLIGCSRTAVWKHMEELRKEGFKLRGCKQERVQNCRNPRKNIG